MPTRRHRVAKASTTASGSLIPPGFGSRAPADPPAASGCRNWASYACAAGGANARKDFLHKVSTDIAKSHGTVVVEALRVRNMTASAKGTAAKPGRNMRQKAGLNRAILDQGWGMFRLFLRYKLAERGSTLIEVPAAYTSQTCSACGIVDAASRRDQARFVCVGCGHEAHADTNAAINILRRAGSSSMPVEGPIPVETGSIRRAA
jgi:putative transposase